MNLRALVLGLLVAAGVAGLPLVYAILSREDAHPVAVLATGLLAMGLPWAGGCTIEGRRRGSVLLITALGAAQGLVPLVPAARAALPAWALAAAALAGLFSLAALVVLYRLPTPWARLVQRDAPVIPE